MHEANAVYGLGAWQTDASRHARTKPVDAVGSSGAAGSATGLLLCRREKEGCSGRRAEEPVKQRTRLVVFEVDMLIGGSDHDLFSEAEDILFARLEDGGFDCIMRSPPCRT